MNFGYARVSTLDQNLSRQLDQLKQEGCMRIYEEKESPRRRDSHERELVELALGMVPYNRSNILDTLNARQRRALLRRFYRTGDLTASKAIDRAIRFAIRSVVE